MDCRLDCRLTPQGAGRTGRHAKYTKKLVLDQFTSEGFDDDGIAEELELPPWLSHAEFFISQRYVRRFPNRFIFLFSPCHSSSSVISAKNLGRKGYRIPAQSRRSVPGIYLDVLKEGPARGVQEFDGLGALRSKLLQRLLLRLASFLFFFRGPQDLLSNTTFRRRILLSSYHEVIRRRIFRIQLLSWAGLGRVSSTTPPVGPVC